MKCIDPVSEFFPAWLLGGRGLFCQLNQSCWKLHEIDRSSLRFSPAWLWGGGFYASWAKVAGICMKCINPISELFSLFGHLRGGVLFCQVPDDMFNDAWSMVQQSYIMWHDTSQVSHQKAEKRRGRAFRPIWIKLRFRPLINIGLSINKRPTTITF